MTKVKILFLSDSSVATHSGFAKVGLELLQRWSKNENYEIAELGICNPPGTKYHTQPNWKIYNSHVDQHGRDVFVDVVRDFEPDIVIALMDIHMSAYINDYKIVPLDVRNSFKAIAHLPIDGAPFPSYWLEVATGWDAIACIHPYGESVLRDAFSTQIAKLEREIRELLRYKEVATDEETTKEIDDELNKRCVFHASYNNSLRNLCTINHGANRDVYKPVDLETKAKLRKKLLIPSDWFVFSFVGRNSPRKMQATLLKAFKEVLAKYPKTFLVMGTAKQDFGWYLDSLAEDYEINPNNYLITDNQVYAGQGFTDQQIAELYQMSDCFVSAAFGGGFELCHLESMLCGIPQIGVKGAGSIDMMVKDHGILVPAKKWNLGGIMGDCDRPLVEPHALADAMKQMIRDTNKRNQWAINSTQFANQECFTWDFAAKEFEKVIEKTLQNTTVGAEI